MGNQPYQNDDNGNSGDDDAHIDIKGGPFDAIILTGSFDAFDSFDKGGDDHGRRLHQTDDPSGHQHTGTDISDIG